MSYLNHPEDLFFVRILIQNHKIFRQDRNPNLFLKPYTVFSYSSLVCMVRDAAMFSCERIYRSVAYEPQNFAMLIRCIIGRCEVRKFYASAGMSSPVCRLLFRFIFLFFLYIFWKKSLTFVICQFREPLNIIHEQQWSLYCIFYKGL